MSKRIILKKDGADSPLHHLKNTDIARTRQQARTHREDKRDCEFSQPLHTICYAVILLSKAGLYKLDKAFNSSLFVGAVSHDLDGCAAHNAE